MLNIIVAIDSEGGIGQENCEDILWQNVIDTVSEIEQNEIGVSVTQSYQYTKLNNEPSKELNMFSKCL